MSEYIVDQRNIFLLDFFTEVRLNVSDLNYYAVEV